jgi:hypothetical protein
LPLKLLHLITRRHLLVAHNHEPILFNLCWSVFYLWPSCRNLGKLKRALPQSREIHQLDGVPFERLPHLGRDQRG